MESRNARIAKNEALFRALNERISNFPEHQAAAPTQRILFVCECGDDSCFEQLSLTRAEYEAVRAHAARFAVTPGHEKPGISRVVERHVHYFVVEKFGDGRDIVERGAA